MPWTEDDVKKLRSNIWTEADILAMRSGTGKQNTGPSFPSNTPAYLSGSDYKNQLLQPKDIKPAEKVPAKKFSLAEFSKLWKEKNKDNVANILNTAAAVNDVAGAKMRAVVFGDVNDEAGGKANATTGNKTLDNVAKAAGMAESFLIPSGEGNLAANLLRQGAEGVVGKVATKTGSKLLNNKIVNKVVTGAVESVPYTAQQIGTQKMDSKEALKTAVINTALGSGTELAIGVLGKGISALRGALKKPVEEIAQSTEAIPLQKVVKPATLPGKFIIKNHEFEKAVDDYNNAIETIQNHFKTNELRANEIPLIKSQLGIDMDDIISRMEQAQNKTLSSADDLRLKRAAGIASDKSYSLMDRLSKQKDTSLTPADLPKKTAVTGGLIKDQLPKVENGTKASGFANTIEQSTNTAGGVKKTLKQNPITYKSISNTEAIAAADKRIANNVEDAVSFVKQTNQPSAEHTATAIQLINKFQKEGNYNRAIDIVEDIAPKLTKAGQAIQAASIYDRISPEGILLFAQRRINKLNDDRWFKGLTKGYSLSADDATNLKKLAEDVQNLTGDAKTEASQELQSALQALGKSGLDRKVESAQTIMQLLNPKTLIRNTVGNELFYRLERINKYVASPIDWAKSTITGADRTVTFRTGGQHGYWDGFLKGAKAGWKGVNPQGLSTQYDLTAPAFKGRWNPLTYMEKTLGATLKGFDYAAYNRAVNHTVGEMAELRAMNEGLSGVARKDAVAKYVEESSGNILDIADQYGKYVTFQDDNLLSKMLSGMKRTLNAKKEFGLGSIIVKYPKTPGALIMRGLDYSPAGFLRSAYLLAKPILSGTAIDSREVTLALSRAITGTVGFTGLGWYLHSKGVITGQANSDKDVAAMEKGTGGGAYKVNVSALYRWVKSGFNDTEASTKSGDTMLSYDWMQPIAMALSFGANMNQNYKEGKSLGDNAPSVIASSMGGALDTIAQQPVLQGIIKQLQGYNLGQNVINTIQSIPASFMPTFLNQVRQIADNTSRSTYDPNVAIEALNMVKNKIPGMEKSLPAAYDTLGEQKRTYQTPSWFNVFFNPANESKFNPTDTQKEILRLYDATGEKIQFPRVADKKINNVQLTPEEYYSYQEILGKETEDYFKLIMEKGNGNYWSAGDDMKARWLQQAITQANDFAKFKILKDRGSIK